MVLPVLTLILAVLDGTSCADMILLVLELADAFCADIDPGGP